MSASKIYYSTYPDAKLPEKDCWHFVFDNPNPPADDKVVYVDALTDKKLKFGELKSLTKRLAYGLVNRAHIGQDDVVLVFSRNTYLYPALVHATQAATICASLANPTYRYDELAHHIKDSRAKILVVGKSVIEVAKKAASECGIEDHNIYMMEEDDYGRYKSVWSLVGTEEIEPRRLSPEEAKERTAFMCYSSGTTGRAKGVETTHRNLTSVIAQRMACIRGNWETERWLALLPLYHIYGLMYFIFLSPFCHAITFILARFDLELMLESIQKYRITRAHIVPPIVLLIAKHPLVDKYDVSSVSGWYAGAAPMALNISELAAKRTRIPVRVGYGMTETTCVISIATNDDMKLATVGKLIPNMMAKLVDGELLLKGPNIMKGYLRNPTANAETFTEDGWMRTGDICKIDEDGYISIVDRIKELIKFKGFQVPPAELEALLLTHPNVVDAAVVGVYDPEQATELPRAYVVLSTNAIGKNNIDVEIATWVTERVANHMRLRGGVKIVDAIPKSASGKILRRLLRDQIKAKL